MPYFYYDMIVMSGTDEMLQRYCRFLFPSYFAIIVGSLFLSR